MIRLLDTNHAIAYLNGKPHLTSRVTAAQAAGDQFGIPADTRWNLSILIMQQLSGSPYDELNP